MRVMLAAAVLLLLTLAGCAENSAPTSDPETQEDAPDVEVTEDTGGIRGVVVDQAIVPVEGVTVKFVESGTERKTTTDANGGFAFSKVSPGTYFLDVSKINYEGTQSTANVEAGNAQPPIIKVQINKLFDQDPFWEMFQWEGFFTCAYAIGVSSTCVNDYTRICGNVHPDCCPGGCLPQVTGVVDNREYVTELAAGWQSIVIEMLWDPSVAGTSGSMGMTMSYYERVGASHNWGCGSGESPFQCRRDYSAIGGEDDFPNKIPAEGIPDLFIFMSAGGGNVAVEQEFEIFHSHFFYGVPEDGWSFVKGDGNPF